MRKFEFIEKIKNDKNFGSEGSKFHLPERSTKMSAGYDFYNPYDVEIEPYSFNKVPTLIPTGIKAQMENDEWLMLVNRSSNPKKKNLVIPNSVGVIDADYYNNPDNEGEIMFAFYNLGKTPITLKAGDKLGQGIFQKYLIVEDDTSDKERVGGFGSTDNIAKEEELQLTNKSFEEFKLPENSQLLQEMADELSAQNELFKAVFCKRVGV